MHDMLLKEFFLLLPTDKVAVEIQETVPVNEAVITACQQLKLKGHRIALDNFVLADPREKLVSYADCLKIDVPKVAQQDCAAIAAKFGNKCTLIAQKVQTSDYNPVSALRSDGWRVRRESGTWWPRWRSDSTCLCRL